MSLKNTEEVLEKFIKSEIPQVLVIKGAWGSGKTYFLENFLKENKDESDLGFKKYSYCSIFGENNIEKLKLKIYHNSIDKQKIGEDNNLFEKYGNIKTGHGIFNFLSKTLEDNTIIKLIDAGISTTGLLEPKDYLVVLDDFERINKDIDTDEILGLISELKEKRKCKIILVMNDEKISKETLLSYNLFKEKVIDIEIEFKPTPNECAGIVLKEESNKEQILLRESCIKLLITNIRVIYKIKHFYNLITPYLREKEYHEELIKQTIGGLVFISNSFFGNPNNDEKSEIPGIDFVLNEDQIGNFNLYGGDKKEPEFSIKWRTIFREYGWSHTDEYDRELYNIIKRGYVVKDDLYKNADNNNNAIIDGNIKKQHTDLWDNLYHIGFVNNEDDFIKGFLDFYKINSKHLDLNDLNTIVSIFRKIGKDSEAIMIIDYFLDGNRGKTEKLNLEDYTNHTSYNLDEEIKIKINTAYHKIKSTDLSPFGIIEKIISYKYSITDIEETILFRLSEVDILKLINSVEGDIQRKYIQALLIKRRISNASEEWKKLTEKTLSAVKQLDTCKINHSRLESYGFLK